MLAPSGRDALAYLLRAVSLLCRGAASACREDVSYAPVVCYEYFCSSRTATSGEYCFDGVPSRVVILRAPVPLPLPAVRSEAERVSISALRASMQKFARDIDAICAVRSQQNRATIEHSAHLVDVSPQVPARVRMFLARFRALVAAAGALQTAQCANRQCRRLFARAEAPAAPRLNWNAAVPFPTFEEDAARFCCRACAEQWWQEARAYRRIAEDFTPPLGGVPYVSLSMVLRRNECVPRGAHARTARAPTAQAASDVVLVTRGFRKRCNVELGVVYVHDLVEQCKHLQRAMRYVSPSSTLRRVETVYDRAGSEHHHPIASIDACDRFLRALRSRVDEMARRVE